MRIIDVNRQKIDVDKKYCVEMTLAEVATIAATLGEMNTAIAARMVRSDYGEELGDASERQNAGSNIFDILDDIVEYELERQ